MPTAERVPSPRGRALLEELRILRQDPLKFLLNAANTYGDFVHLPLGVLNAYLLNHPDAVRHVLLDNHRGYSKDTFQYNMLSKITGQGLLTSDGDFWLRQRRLAQPAFHRSRLAALSGMITTATQKMLDSWEQAAVEGCMVDIDAEMMRLTLEIVGKALFSVDLHEQAGELAGATLTALDHLVYSSRNPFRLPPPFPSKQNRRFQAALNKLDRVVYSLIRERRAVTHGKSSQAETEDLLSLLLQARDPETGEGMDERQLRDEILTLLIAGHETVASALTWTWYLLASHPGEMNRLYAEIFTVLGGNNVTASDLQHLTFTQHVFDEALRLYPPAWIITRKALDRDAVYGFPIQANSLVIISPYTMHRHPAFWERFEAFDPDRFSPDRSAALPRFAYIPFGGGPRLCIGDSFAKMEASLIIATVAQRYRLELPPGQEIEVEALVTLRPRQGMKMFVRKI